MKALRRRYDGLPIDRLDARLPDHAPAPPPRPALNKYIDAANAWGECLAEAGCTTASIEGALQRKWRIASHYLSEAA